jgi:hypothetical protein
VERGRYGTFDADPPDAGIAWTGGKQPGRTTGGAGSLVGQAAIRPGQTA